IDDENIQVSIVVEVSEGTATANMRVGNRWSGFLQKFLKTAIPEIAEEKPLAPEGVFGEALLEFSVDVARHDEEVGQPIVIEIHDPCAPAHKSIFDTERSEEHTSELQSPCNL